MRIFSRFCLWVPMLAFAGMTSAVAAEQFPSKPIRLVVSSSAGGLLDATTRLIGQKMSDQLGQPVIVENRVGAGGLVSFRSMKTTPADGYTLLVTTNTVAVMQAFLKDPGYDPVKDLTGIGPLTRSPLLMMVSADHADKNLGDLMKRAKANPGQLSYATAGIGTTIFLGTTSFLHAAGLDLMHVPYKGNSAAWPDVIAGRTGMIFEPYGSAAPLMRAGRLKALGVSSTKRLDTLPEVPTMAEQGVPGYSFYIWLGMFAPTGTPKDVVQKLSTALRSALASPELASRFQKEGSEVMAMPPEEFNQFVKSEAAVASKLVTDLGIPKE